nr:serine/threonine-protein phosphatase 6 regulatory ankyrin repeat subunit B-like [Parasteatoda tepidariorum]
MGLQDMVIYFLNRGADVNSEADNLLTPLHLASYAGHTETVQTLISKGANVNAKDSFGCPLHYAAINGHSCIVEVLLIHGADINALGDRQCLPLHLAIKKGHINVLKTLIKYGLSIKDVAKNDASLFEYAIPHKNLELINILIDNKAPINARNNNGNTPLHLSVRDGSTDIVSRLIECGADINASNKNGLTPLSLAIRLGYFEIADKLLSASADIHSVNNEGQTLLHICALNSADLVLLDEGCELNGVESNHNFIQSSRLDIFKKLLVKGSDFEARDIFGRTSLHEACNSGYIEIVQYLIDLMTDIDIQDKQGFTPLHYAVSSNHLEIVNILIASGKCSLKSKTLKNDTVLCLSSKKNYAELTRFLISKGADVNDGDPLYKSLVQGNQDICIILLQKKSTDIEKQFRGKSETLLHLATLKGMERLVSYVLDKKKKLSNLTDINDSLSLAIHSGFDDIVSVLLTHGADVNIVFEDHTTPLHIATARGHSKIIKILLDSGADFNKVTTKYPRPIAWAVWQGHLDSVKIFFENTNVNVNEKLDGKFTFLHIAAKYGHLDIIKFLISKNAIVNIADSEGSKPVHFAVQSGNLIVVKYFIQINEKILTERGFQNRTSLHYAVETGQAEMVKFLIENGLNVNESSDYGRRPIHLAAKFGFDDVLKVLLDNGAQYDCVDDIFHNTPLLLTVNEGIKKMLQMIKELFLAVKCNNISNLKSLIEKGACINAKDLKDATLLHYAAWKGYANIIQILLENGGEPNARGKNDATPLHYASKYGKLEAAKTLLENGAIYNVMTADRKTPLGLASSNDVVDLLKLIDHAFKCVLNCNIQILSKLENFKNSYSLKSVAGAKNREGKTLITCAMLNDFPKLGDLKNIFFKNCQTSIDECIKLILKENYDEALRNLNDFQKKTAQNIGLDNPISLESDEISAFIMYKQQKYKQALDIFEKIFEKKKEIFGLSDGRTLNTQFTIATIFHKLGRFSESLKICEEVYTQQNKIFGLDHVPTLITLCHMTEVLCALERPEDALKKNNIALKKFIQMFGPFTDLTVLAQNCLGHILTDLGRYDEALTCYECVYEYNNKVLNSSHSETLLALFKTKRVLCLRNLTDKSLKELRDVLEIQKKILGSEHIYTVYAEMTVGELLFKSGKYEEGIKIYKDSVEKQKAILGDDHSAAFKLDLRGEKMKNFMDLENSSDSGGLHETKQFPASHEMLFNELFNFVTIDSEERTILHFAASEGHLHLVKDALKKGCNLMQTTQKGNTALHIASSKGHAEIAEKLLMHAKENSFDELNTFVNARTRNGGNSALHAAASIEIVKICLKYGAIYNIRNKDGKTPKDYTTVKEISDFLQHVEELFIGASIGDSKLISKLKNLQSEEKLAVSNARNEQNHTLFQVAVNKGHENIIEWIKLNV